MRIISVELFDKIKNNWAIVLICALLAIFLSLGQFSDSLRKTGLLCKTPVDAAFDCYNSWRMCTGLSNDECKFRLTRFGEVKKCDRGCS